jgi:subtilisin family serine protease
LLAISLVDFVAFCISFFYFRAGDKKKKIFFFFAKKYFPQLRFVCRIVPLLALIVAANAAKLDGALGNLLYQSAETLEKNTALHQRFTAQFPWLATSGSILEHFSSQAGALKDNVRIAFEQARAHVAANPDAAPTMRASGAVLSKASIPIRCTTRNGDGEDVVAHLGKLGVKAAKAHGAYVSGLISSDDLGALAKDSALKSCRFDSRVKRAGRVTSQGDRAAGSNVARSLFGLTGKGVVVGIISDSFGCDRGAVADDIASGDLPADSVILEEYAPCLDNFDEDDDGVDEGRAMAQLIHDMAPDASIRFCSGANGFFSFIDCIDRLVAEGCDVIVDDLFYHNEAYFQDDFIAQAVNRAAAAGVAYFSAAGNSARESWEGPFVKSSVILDLGGLEDQLTLDSGTTDSDLFEFDASDAADDDDDDDAFLHEFDLSSEEFATPFLPQLLVSEADEDTDFITHLQWSDPFPSIAERPNLFDLPKSHIGLCTVSIGFSGGFDIDFACHVNIIDLGGCDDGDCDDDDGSVSIDNDDEDEDDFGEATHGVQLLDDDPSIVTAVTTKPGLNIVLHFAYTRERHRLPERMKFMFDFPQGEFITLNPWDTESGTVTGHANAAGAFAVGAAFFRNTPEFGGELRVEPFSSAGGTPILFDGDGIRLPRPDFRQKPDFTCVDGVDTTFFGSEIDDDTPEFPNFFGTSASAPAAAAIAALMLEAQPSLTVPEVYKILRETAVDFDDFGFDFNSGHGFCNAAVAVQKASDTRPSHVAQAGALNLTFCTAHGTVQKGACPEGAAAPLSKRQITVTGNQRVSIQSHLNYARLEHQDDVSCGPSTTLLVDGKIVWKTTDTTFTRTGTIDGHALVDLADGTHTAKIEVRLEDCKAKFAFSNSAIVATKVDDITDLVLVGGLLEVDTSSDFSSSSSSSDSSSSSSK